LPLARDLCKTSPFASRHRRDVRSAFYTKWSFSSILEILNVCLRLKSSPFLNLNKIEHFSKVSVYVRLHKYCCVCQGLDETFAKQPLGPFAKNICKFSISYRLRNRRALGLFPEVIEKLPNLFKRSQIFKNKLLFYKKGCRNKFYSLPLRTRHLLILLSQDIVPVNIYPYHMW